MRIGLDGSFMGDSGLRRRGLGCGDGEGLLVGSNSSSATSSTISDTSTTSDTGTVTSA